MHDSIRLPKTSLPILKMEILNLYHKEIPKAAKKRREIPCAGKQHLWKSGAHHEEPATTPYSCHGVFTERSVFSLNISRIQIPTETSVINCNHKHGLMLTCRHDVSMLT